MFGYPSRRLVELREELKALRGEVRELGFSVAAGEVVGLTGLPGRGFGVPFVVQVSRQEFQGLCGCRFGFLRRFGSFASG